MYVLYLEANLAINFFQSEEQGKSDMQLSLSRKTELLKSLERAKSVLMSNYKANIYHSK